MNKHILLITVCMALVLAVFTCGVDLGHAQQGAAKAKTSGQGMRNAKRVMQAKLERDKKMREVKQRAQAMRQKAQSGK